MPDRPALGTFSADTPLFVAHELRRGRAACPRAGQARERKVAVDASLWAAPRRAAPPLDDEEQRGAGSLQSNGAIAMTRTSGATEWREERFSTDWILCG